MNILVVSQYFWPESFRINELVASLALRGIDINVLTGKPNYPDGKIFAGYRATGCMRETWNGVRIFRVPLFPRGRNSGFRLALNYLSFILFGTIMGGWQLRTANIDLIFVYAPSPLLQTLPAILIGCFKRVPVVLYVQDLWPESIEATGYIRSRSIISLVGLVVQFIYRHVDLILTSSRSFAPSIRRFSPTANIVYYPNSVDSAFCNPNSGAKPSVPALDEGFTVVFAGNVGSAQAVHVIVEAAELLISHAQIRLVIFGSGSQLEWVRQQKQKKQLDNLHLAGRFPVEAMPFLLAKASVLLVTLADRHIFEATVPNKIQAYMAVGRPIIACMNGEGAKLVTEANAGIAVVAEDSRALAGAILKLYKLPPEEQDKLGANGKAYYLDHFDHEKLISELIKILDGVTKKKL